MNGFAVIIWKEFRQLSRDKAGLRLMILIPLVQMMVLGYAITTEVRHIPIAILDMSGTPQSRSLVNDISANRLFLFLGHVESEADLRRWMDRGRIRIGLSIPPDFAVRLEESTHIPQKDLMPGLMGAPLHILIDGQDANSSSVAKGYLQAILSGWSAIYLERKLNALGMRMEQVIPVQSSNTVLFNPSLQSSWYMVPGIAVILVTMVTALLTGFSIVKEKEAGTLEQLMVTPLNPYQLVIGKTVPFFIVGLVELMGALAMAKFWFGLPFRGSIPVLFLFACIYMLSSLGIGILTSTIARTQQQALFIIWFFLLFFMLLSGFFMPVENMPPWVQTITLANPVRYFMHILREIFLKGSGITELWLEGLAMLGIGVTVFSSAVLNFNRRST